MRPISAIGWRTVVSAGVTIAATLRIVEADDRELLRHTDAALARHAQGPDRDVVVEGEDGRGRIGRVEQARGGLGAAFDVERGLEHHRGVRQHAGRGQRALVAVQALAAGEVRARPGDRADAPVAEREQVLGRGPSARGVGGGDGRDALVERHARVDDHERVALAAQHLELGVGLLRQH